MKLKVGGKYKNRKGQVTAIVEELGGEIYPFIDSQDCSYTPEGIYLRTHPSHVKDLLEEIYMFDLNATYLTKSAQRVVIIARTPNRDYPIVGLSQRDDTWSLRCWTEDGIYDEGCEGHLDLVKVSTDHLRTRNGTMVKIYERYENEIHGAYFSDDVWKSSTWTAEGGFYQVGTEQSCLDIDFTPLQNWTAGIEFPAQAGAGVATGGKACYQPDPAAVGAERINL